LEQIERYIGKVWYVIEQYEGLKLIEVPLSKTEIMFISTEIDSDHYSILKYVRENITNAHDARVDELKPPSSQSSSMITHFILGFPDIIDYDEACSKIYSINGVILANIYDLNSSLTNKFCINIQSNNSHILGREGMGISIRNAWRVWKIRRKFESKIGRGICAVAEYDAVRRMTIPLLNSALLFIIMRKDIDPFKLLHEIRDILNKDEKEEDGK
jgi:hypothetical protein